MKSFSTFVNESYVRFTTHKEIVDAIAPHKKAGEIVNPVYKDLGSQARRVFGKDTDVGREMILKVMHAGDAAGRPRDPDLTELYYTWPHDSFQSLGKFEKALLKVEKMNKQNMGPVIKIGKEILANWKPVAEDLKMLKGKVVKITAKRAQAKQVAAKEMGARFADSSSLIKVLESHLDEYKAMAKQRAKEFIEKRLEFLSKHDWDLNKAFPPWRGGLGADYKARASQENLFSYITKTKGSYTGRRNDPHIVEPDQQKIDRYVANSVKEAEESYREFMQKMITKIGKPVVDAKMYGNIWTNAVLRVTTNDGEEQVWNTKMILNFSKYQKMFNQFPTRRKK
jgi:hypothetical protein